MRIAIDQARKEFAGPVAVVCGAWHVPALKKSHKLKDDRELLKGLPKVKTSITWTPWTQPRLAQSGGYGAGVRHPGWYDHLWHYSLDPACASRWLIKIARLLRDKGHFISTAGLIEAERLAKALASLRERPSPNFEELRDATIACLCGGETLIYQTIVADLLVGSAVGQISPNTPLAPLIEDLQTQQRKAKLKPEALERALSLDLRSESGLFRSTLLHRLSVLGVPWGVPTETGRSRGTFRENWKLRWEPEYAVKLVEQLPYGATIEQAASQKLVNGMAETKELHTLAALMQMATKAQLSKAIEQGIDFLGKKVALTSDCQELLLTLAPMAEVLRYGEARSGSQQYLAQLMRQISLQAFIALPYAARDLGEEAAANLSDAMLKAQRALQLAELSSEEMTGWYQALRSVMDQSVSTPSLAGLAARLLYEAELLLPEEAAIFLRRQLSPGIITAASAGYFEGFLGGIAERLIHDKPLLEAVDNWLMDLDEQDWLKNLPLFRRVFSGLDSNVRHRLVQAIVRPGQNNQSLYVSLEKNEIWSSHYLTLIEILKKGAPV